MTTLDQIQHLVDELTPLEQVRLLEYLTPRIARAVATFHKSEITAQNTLPDAWQQFFHIGDQLASTDSASGETLTQAVVRMRR